MDTKTFTIYPFDGASFSVDLVNNETDGETFTIYSNERQAIAFLDRKHIAAIYHPNEPPTDWRLVSDQPRLFKVYLRNHTDLPLEIYAHYFKALENDTLEFHYRIIHEASGPTGTTIYSSDETLHDIHIKRSEVVAIVSSEPLPAPPQP